MNYGLQFFLKIYSENILIPTKKLSSLSYIGENTQYIFIEGASYFKNYDRRDLKFLLRNCIYNCLINLSLDILTSFRCDYVICKRCLGEKSSTFPSTIVHSGLDNDEKTILKPLKRQLVFGPIITII